MHSSKSLKSVIRASGTGQTSENAVCVVS